MKKVITFCLALVLILSVVPVAHADELDDVLVSISQTLAESDTNKQKTTLLREGRVVYIDLATFDAATVSGFAARGMESYIEEWAHTREEAMAMAQEMQMVLDDLESGLVCIVRLTQLYSEDIVYLAVTADTVIQDITAIKKPSEGTAPYFNDLVSGRNAAAGAQIYSHYKCRWLNVLIRREPGSHRLAWLVEGDMPGSGLLWDALVEECRADLESIESDMVHLSERASVIYAVLDDSDGSLLLLFSNKNVIYDRVRGVDIFTGAFRSIT